MFRDTSLHLALCTSAPLEHLQTSSIYTRKEALPQSTFTPRVLQFCSLWLKFETNNFHFHKLD